MPGHEQETTAEVVVPCEPLAEALGFFVDRLGFRLDAIFPADDPRIAIVSGHGVRLRLERGIEGAPPALVLRCADPSALVGDVHELVAPGGIRVRIQPLEPAPIVPPLRPSLQVSRARDAAWHTGRADMQYRDLVPDRQGGRFVASHIRIPVGGPVPDYVHFHAVRFQMIFCHRGWVRVVYEGQGPPFVLHAGDCVLQPPRIRHRVLEASDGLEVIEIGCPADHETAADHALTLPTVVVQPDRDFDGQRFVRHQAAHATSQAFRLPGFRARDLGIGAATRGLASAHVARPQGTPTELPLSVHDAELRLGFVLSGEVALRLEGSEPTRLGTDDAFVVPPGLPHSLADWSHDFQLLEIEIGARTPGEIAATTTSLS